MHIKKECVVFWMRRDLRLHDNCGLYHALNSGLPVIPIFIFDQEILDDLKDKSDARVSFIHSELKKINTELREKGSRILCLYGNPQEVFKTITESINIKGVYTNHDYEPYAIKRDQDIKLLLAEKGIAFYSFKDQVVFEKDEIVKEDGSPYLVYTPYSKKWMSSVDKNSFFDFSTKKGQFLRLKFKGIMPLGEIGFKPSSIKIPKKALLDKTMKTYAVERNFPAKDSTSRLGVHLRFGTVSPREIARRASEVSETFYKELIWREFFMSILYHFPHVVGQNYNSKYDGIEWQNNEEDFKKWKAGKTGYPLVDAGMRELNSTGFMHNRVRMVVASFLCKHLLIDWKWGEAYFAEKLLDYDLASNNGNWQWCAGTGVDASPYFRVFNPSSQIDKFDKNMAYVKRWVKEYGTNKYPEPMVDHKRARERAIEVYKKGIKPN